jgi:hypothetical protein
MIDLREENAFFHVKIRLHDWTSRNIVILAQRRSSHALWNTLYEKIRARPFARARLRSALSCSCAVRSFRQSVSGGAIGRTSSCSRREAQRARAGSSGLWSGGPFRMILPSLALTDARQSNADTQVTPQSGVLCAELVLGELATGHEVPSNAEMRF